MKACNFRQSLHTCRQLLCLSTESFTLHNAVAHKQSLVWLWWTVPLFTQVCWIRLASIFSRPHVHWLAWLVFFAFMLQHHISSFYFTTYINNQNHWCRVTSKSCSIQRSVHYCNQSWTCFGEWCTLKAAGLMLWGDWVHHSLLRSQSSPSGLESSLLSSPGSLLWPWLFMALQITPFSTMWGAIASKFLTTL